MPITQKTLRYYRPQGNGKFKVREDHTDARGNSHLVSYRTTKSQVEVEVDMNARVIDLASGDNQELLSWVKSRNTVASFDYTNRDINQLDGEEFIFQWFAESDGDEAITVAWWMDSINTGTFNNIRDRIGYTGQQGADITSRFQFMVLVEPWYNFTVSPGDP